MSRWIHELAWPEIEAYLRTEDIALVPIGATEQHGPHLPLMVDAAWAIAVAEGAAEAANVLVAPPMYIGWSPHHLGYPGGITLRAETLTQVTVDIGESLVHHGFRKLLLVNGNRVANLPPMEIAATRLRFQTGAYVAVVDVGLIAKREVREICESEPGGLGHAGESETSFMLYRYGQFVDMTKATKVLPSRKRFPESHIALEPEFEGNSVSVHPTDEEFRRATAPTGAGGDALLATREKGERIFHAIVRNLVAYIDEVRRIPVTVKSVPIPV
jgi:creatinine amidohydrolase